MKRNLFLVMLLLCGFASPVLAATSEELRSKEWLYLGLVAGSFDLSTKFGYTYKIGLHLGSSILVGIENLDSLGNGEFDFGNGETISNTEHHSRGFFVRWFPLNSFNVFMGQYRRKFSTDYVYEEEPYLLEPGRSVSGRLEGQIEVKRYGIGNMWTLDNGASIGMDWVVQTQVIREEAKATLESQEGYAGDLSAQKRLEMSAQNGVDYFKQSGWLIATVGFSF